MVSKDNKNLRNITTEDTECHRGKRNFLIKSSVLLRVTPWLILLLVISCKTVPTVPDVFLEENRFIPLNRGASVYLMVNVKEARSILEHLPIEELKDSQVAQMMDRTDYAVVALFPEESGQYFQIAAWGNYPSSRAGMAFSFNRNWKKQSSLKGESYWYSNASGLSMVVEQRQVFAAASLLDGVPFEPVASAPGVEIPEGFNDFRHENSGLPSSVYGWVDNPASMISQIMAGLPIQFPVKELFLNLFVVDENQYEAKIRLQFENATQARGMAAIINLARNFAPDDPVSVIFFANSPVQNGASIDITSSSLNQSELSLLLEMFLL